MHLPIVWQWFPACRDFSVPLQANCKRRNQRQPRRCHTTAEDRLVWSADPIPHSETQLNIAGIVEGAKPRSPASKSRGVVIASFRSAESMAFKGEFRQWEHLLRIGD